MKNVIDRRPLVLHVMYRFDTGGLENGVVNLINEMPSTAYRHAVLALTEVTDFRDRVQRPDVEFHSLHKPPGHGFWQFGKLFKLFRQLRPAIVHSRNLAALEVQAPAWAAGVPARIHGEHGRDVGDIDGANVTNQRVRRFYRPFVHHYVALSRDLNDYLVRKSGVPQKKITQVYNGVDSTKFCPAESGPTAIFGCPFSPGQHRLVGTVGRMQVVKDQIMLAQAFLQALSIAPCLKAHLRLVMVGEGPLRAPVQSMLDQAGVGHLAWLPGERSDVDAIMSGLHVFALPSLAEGISNTILEAMASALPVVATGVGGNADLVIHGQTGFITPPSDPHAMAQRLIALANNPLQAQIMGRAGRDRVLEYFNMQSMVSAYQRIYDKQLGQTTFTNQGAK
jgi:sugar transferase (PEP-CTERM/EpsH1 system associated)